MSEYLRFEKICMEFPGVKALDDMSFGVNKGEIVAFLGENGAGKSTLLKILNGDYRHTSGKIFIDDKEVEFHSPNEAIKAGISVIYQERQLAPYLSVAENIFMGNPISRAAALSTLRSSTPGRRRSSTSLASPSGPKPRCGGFRWLTSRWSRS